MIEKNHQELNEILKEGKKVLLDVYGTFCGPCKVLLPKLETLEKEYPNIVFLKMDVQKNMTFVNEKKINSVPTVLIFNGEELINRSTGVHPDMFYREILKKL